MSSLGVLLRLPRMRVTVHPPAALRKSPAGNAHGCFPGLWVRAPEPQRALPRPGLPGPAPRRGVPFPGLSAHTARACSARGRPALSPPAPSSHPLLPAAPSAHPLLPLPSPLTPLRRPSPSSALGLAQRPSPPRQPGGGSRRKGIKWLRAAEGRQLQSLLEETRPRASRGSPRTPAWLARPFRRCARTVSPAAQGPGPRWRRCRSWFLWPRR